jgi:2-keto-3-deoxy-L-rhamnonate aldolase RhmA
MQVRNLARERLQNGEMAIGVGIRTARTVDIAKMMKTAGFDWLFIDLEHGPMSIEFATTLAVAALDTGISPIVRVPFMQHTMATRVLDSGALGIVMPHVDTPEQAREIVDHLKYPPVGHRSLAGSQAIFDFKPLPISEMVEAANTSLLVIPLWRRRPRSPMPRQSPRFPASMRCSSAPTISPPRWAFPASSAVRRSPRPTRR